MPPQAPQLGESFLADGALMRTLPSVRQPVTSQPSSLREPSFANFTLVNSHNCRHDHLLVKQKKNTRAELASRIDIIWYMRYCSILPTSLRRRKKTVEAAYII